MGLDLVELVMAFEEEFGIEISDAASEALLTPGDVISYVVIQLRARGKAPDRQTVAETVRRLTIVHLGLRPKHYREDARFVEDFGAG